MIDLIACFGDDGAMKTQNDFLQGQGPQAPLLSREEKLARMRLIRTDTVGPTTFRRLIARFGSAIAAIEAIPDLARAGGRKAPLKIPQPRQCLDELKRIADYGAKPLFLGDRAYPPLLAAIEDAPPVLITKGAPHLFERQTIGIVGARNASMVARQQAEKLGRELAEQGICVISGLARGIDTAAHQGALKGGTIAVVAGGIDIYYPRENEALQRAIAEQGLLVSDEPLGVQPQARHFPKRNRIISGLSLGVLVVEATQKSGSLITARLALEQGREVFAIPGSPLDPRCKGTNALIKSGAALIECTDDILDAMAQLRPPLGEPEGMDYGSKPMPQSDDIPQSARHELRGLLSVTPVRIDDLIRMTGYDAAMVLTILLELELAGLIERLPGSKVALTGSGFDTPY